MTGFGAEQKRCHLADGLPLTLRDRSLAVRRSDGKVCPIPLNKSILSDYDSGDQ